MPIERSPNKAHHSNPDLSSYGSEAGQNITTRKRKQPECDLAGSVEVIERVLQSAMKELRQDLDAKLRKIDDNINNIKSELISYTTEVKNEISALRQEQTTIKQTVSDLSQEVSSVKDSMQYHSDQYDDLKKQVDSLSTQVNNMNKSGSSITLLESKIDTLEQQARQCNIEITNLTERKGENLTALLETSGNTINCTIHKNDIVSVHRVPHSRPDNKKPKNVIVKFTTRTLRDNVMSAHRLNKSLTTGQLGISGVDEKVFINEHLTLKNKQLFRQVREIAKKHDYKYTWIKNATILVRKSDSSPIFAIRGEKDLEKIKSS